MAKKKEKGKKKKDSAGPRDAVRGAVESTFQRAAGGASRAQELLDDVATTLKTLRDANLVETLESVRAEVQSLARRVAALEISTKEPEKPASRRTSPARKPAAGKPAARKPAAKPGAARTKTAGTGTRAKAGGTASRSTGTRSTAARGTARKAAPQKKKPSA